VRVEVILEGNFLQAGARKCGEFVARKAPGDVAGVFFWIAASGDD
jgi:hypothetical protein